MSVVLPAPPGPVMPMTRVEEDGRSGGGGSAEGKKFPPRDGSAAGFGGGQAFGEGEVGSRRFGDA